jgi:flagellar hook-associated protein 3 FlgL
MRVTQGMGYLQALSSLQQNYRRLFDNQAELASGRRVRTASDDPAGAARILGYARQQAAIAQYQDNLESTRSALEDAASELMSITDLFHQAREKIVQAVNGTLSEADRATLADAIDHDITAMFGFLNSRVGDRYVFAGTKTDVAPFARQVGPDGLERVVYLGDSLANRVDVGPGVSEAHNIPGNRLLDVGARIATTFHGTTGAKPGAGSDSGIGRARLLVSHTQTLFGAVPGATVDGASGLRAGASSPALDTILGQGHSVTLVVNGAGTGGTVSLDGAPPVPFASTDTNLAVKNAAGDQVWLDLSQTVAGFSGMVQLDARGTLSLDGGQKTKAIDFAATAQQVIAPDGTVTHVDSTGITRTGTEDVTYGGTLDLFNALLTARDLIRTTGTPQDVAGASDRARALLDEIDRGENAVLRVISDAGSASERLEGLGRRLSDLDLAITSHRSEIEDADLTSLLTELHENESVYQSSLLITARLSQLSLSNFLG